MDLPEFFEKVPRLLVRDPLAEFLGAARDGLLEYGYGDAVRLAGHSCPTVAGAYLMTCRALQHLYGDAVPERGQVRVSFCQSQDQGVTGVMASVAGLLTGAAGPGGFAGLAGRFGRRGLLAFGQQGDALAAFSLVNGRSGGNEASVQAQLNLGVVPADPAMGELLQLCLTGQATPEEQAAFRQLWQDRVRRILLEHWDDPELLRLTAAG